MIEWLDIQNFKCFQQLRLSLGDLTLLTGFNGGGKSSSIQPLLLLSQNLRILPEPDRFALNGSLVRLGTVGDVLPSDPGQGAVKFGVASAANEFSWYLTSRSGDRYMTLQQFAVNGSPQEQTDATRTEVAEATSTIARNLANLTYISAVREGTADAYPIPGSSSEESRGVGIDGRFAPYLYDRHVDDDIPTLRLHPSEPATSLRKQVDYWIGTLFPGAQADAQLVPQVSLLSLQFRLSEIGPWRRPANIGYGLTYAFPIIVALLTAADGQIIVIDSPEAHLHPSAQSQMGRLLAHFASAGVQIIVESHSDHLLNGARLAVKERILRHHALQMHFFTGASKNWHGVISPSVDATGAVSDWPDGFFDQTEKDLSRLAGWD